MAQKKDTPKPAPTDVNPPPLENETDYTEANLGESLRSLELMGRGFTAVLDATRRYTALRHEVNAMTLAKETLEKKVYELGTHAKEVEEHQAETLRRFEKERLAKDAEQKAAHEKTKAELKEETVQLAQAVQDMKDRVAAAEKTAVDAEQAMTDKITEFEDKVIARKHEIEAEIRELEQPLMEKQAEYQDLVDSLQALKLKYGLVEPSAAS